MNKNEITFIAFDCDMIFDFLVQKNNPIMEIELLKLITKERYFSKTQEKLYSYHFSLYNALYKLKFIAGIEGYYLHLDPMRIRLIKVPTKTCHFYNEIKGSYCSNTAIGNYCETHFNQGKQYLYKLEFNPLQDFYLNEENIVFGDSELLKKIMQGFVVFAFKKNEINSAIDFFKISKPTKQNIQTKYHHLAKEYHPDKNNGNDEKMKKLNAAYQVLQEVFVV